MAIIGNNNDGESKNGFKNDVVNKAADMAIASKNPHAMAAGAAVKALNNATRGKPADAFGRFGSRGKNIPSAGKKTQDALGTNPENKDGSNPTGEGNQAAPGENKNADDLAKRKLKQSKFNQARNWIKNRRKKKKGTVTSEETAKKESSSESGSESSTTDDKGEDFLAKRAKRFVVKILLIGAAIVFGFLVVIAFIAGIFGVDIVSSFPAMNVSSYGTDQFESVYDKDSEEYKEETAYYEKIQEIQKNHLDTYKEELKFGYLHAALIYINYTTEPEDEKKPIDYKKMTDMADTIYDLMKPSDSTKEADFEINGEIYNNLKNSSEFKEYYKELLKKEPIDEVLAEIFEFGKSINEVDNRDETVLTNETKVTVPVSSSNDKPTATQIVTKKLTINEYIADSIYASTSDVSNAEMVKAYTITYSTNIVSENKKLSINSSTASASNALCSTKEGCSYDSNGNLVNGPGERSNKNDIYYNGGYYYKTPLSSSEQANLTKNINSVFGNVLVNQDGTYPSLDSETLGGLGEGDYKTILQDAYGDLKTKNVGENSYILDGSYGTEKVLTPVIFYDQKDYPGYSFCGLKGSTIAGSGCGVTSMAIVASTYENDRKYSPIYMNAEATKMRMCGGGDIGTKQAFFGKEANAMGYKFASGTKYNKSFLNLVLKHLSQGHLVIVNVKKGIFTSGGHYMVLGGVDPDTQKVYVYDPNNRTNKSISYRKSGNGWYSFNDVIVKEGYSFFIIWKG